MRMIRPGGKRLTPRERRYVDENTAGPRRAAQDPEADEATAEETDEGRTNRRRCIR